MWPWGHLAVGYVAFSAFVRLGLRSRPSDRGVLVLAVATQLPDLVDKPLAWQFGLLNNGVGVAHSLLVGVPAALALGIALGFRGYPELGAGVAIGYGSHVLGDLLFAALFSQPPILPAFLWPVYTTPAAAAPGLGAKTWQLLLDSLALFGGGMGRTYVLLEVLLIGGTVVLWILDGKPGWTLVRTFGRTK
jgi:hypothetical protein